MDELRIVEKKSMATPTTRFIFAWLGIKRGGPYRYTFNDGMVLQTYPVSTMTPEWSNILRGSSDVTGRKFDPYLRLILGRKYKEGKSRCLNSVEMIYKTFTAKEGSPELDRIRDYDGPLNTNPELWPEPYRTAYLESH